MDFREFEVMYRAEGGHWWYQGLREIMFRQTGLGHAASRTWKILDAGCGTGGTLDALRRTGHLQAQGFDYNESAIYFCRQRGLHNTRHGSITAIPFPGDEFDLAIANDVLCDTGTSNEGRALRELYRVLRPGGRLFLNLPAYAFLRSEHDQATDVNRRYTLRPLRRKVSAAGFQIVRLSHWNTALFPLVVVVRLRRRNGKDRDRATARSDIRMPPAAINRVLAGVIRLESRLLDWVTIPYGSSIMCLARKPARPRRA